jgi:hypothetical protein
MQSLNAARPYDEYKYVNCRDRDSYKYSNNGKGDGCLGGGSAGTSQTMDGTEEGTAAECSTQVNFQGQK